MTKFKTFLFFILFTQITIAQIYTQKDIEICNSKFDFAVKKNLAVKPINEVVIDIAKTFLGLDYKAHTLEQGDKETLVINLTGLDCYTFFETSLVFARCIKKGKITFDDFQKEVTNVRYRNGKIDKYPSRLHYASDWLYDNDKRGIVKDITKEIGGMRYKKEINFMSTHPQSYPRLKNNPVFVQEIKEIENKMNKREYYYVPQNFIACVEDKIQSGDIILITTGIEGLDISHTGMAIKMDDGRIHFLHAPLAGKKVQITKEPLADYIKKIKRHTGIMVARVLEP